VASVAKCWRQNPQISQLSSLAAIQWTYRICKFMKERDWSINTAATAVPLTATPPIVVAIRNTFCGKLYSLRVLSFLCRALEWAGHIASFWAHVNISYDSYRITVSYHAPIVKYCVCDIITTSTQAAAAAAAVIKPDRYSLTDYDQSGRLMCLYAFWVAQETNNRPVLVKTVSNISGKAGLL